MALVVSFFTSMGGVSGAVLLLPFQMSVLDYTTPSVSATNQLFNVVAIPSGVLRYIREGRMVWPLTWVVILGTVPGVLIGAIVRAAYLPDPRAFKLFASAVLLYIGSRMIRDLLWSRQGEASGGAREEARLREPMPKYQGRRQDGQLISAVVIRGFSPSRIRYEFCGEEHELTTVGIFALSFAVGIVGGIYGIGGGAIIAPFLVTFFGLPVYIVAGAALMGTFVTSVAGVGFYLAIAPLFPEQSISPDWLLGLLFGLGGAVGMYLGARCQKYVSARLIKGMLAAILLFTAGKYVVEFLHG